MRRSLELLRNTDEHLFAAGLDCRDGAQVFGEVCWIERFDVHLNERNEGTSEIGKLSPAAVHNRSGRRNNPAVVTHDLNRFLHPPAAGHDIFRDEETLAGANFKTAS